MYIYLFICTLKEWEDFRLIYKGFTCKVGLGQLNQVNLHPARHEFKRKPTKLNLSPTRARNQRKFAPNPSPIRIRIPACTSVSIFGITFVSDIQSRWFKLGWKFNLIGLQLCSLPKVRIMTLNGPKFSVNWSLKIWYFLQTGIGFLYLFKGSLGKNSVCCNWRIFFGVFLRTKGHRFMLINQFRWKT